MRNSNTLLIGKVLLDFSSLPSTNQYAQEWLAAERPDEGAVVSARAQTQGKGQGTTAWESEPGRNIALSVILYPYFLPAVSHFLLSQTIALGARDFVASYVPGQVTIKWPNDIYINNRKVAGILIQNTLNGSRFQTCIAGIGINVNQTEFPAHLPNPVSFAASTGSTFELAELRESLFLCLEEWYLKLKAGETEQIRQTYLNNLYRFRTDARFRRADGSIFEGRITGVTDQGRLLIRHSDGEEHFDLKEVSFI
ncbi:MAG: biotin--[acetyl-CoA-carboxylase] ligase [Saprospiraceae bacterium]|nr:biotin--[acetyl-CoA-carboxylase] ligase [Saprospiraceae bacterium]